MKSAVQLVSTMLECLKCGHQWFTRGVKLPDRCPNCGVARIYRRKGIKK